MFNFLKNILSNFPFFYKLFSYIKNFYFDTKVFYFIEKNQLNSFNITTNNYLRFNKKNLMKVIKKKEDFYLFFCNKKLNKKKIILIFDQLRGLLLKRDFDIVYDGNCPYYSEIITKKTLLNFSNEYDLEKYPHNFFYFFKKNKLCVGNIGLDHRTYNFNGSFLLPGGGRSIGDGGDVDFRLNFIPDLTGKTFLDIGSEEGYSVFNAIEKNADFAKGINIKENEEYDFFPNYLRPKNITSRKREDIEQTILFLKKLYSLENSKRVSFEYKNIYNLKNEQYDFVFCFGVLYHLKNPYLAIENLYKATKEVLVIETQGSLQIGSTAKNVYSAILSPEDGFIRHSPESLKFLLLKAGFSSVEILFSGVNKQKKISNIVLKAIKKTN